DLVPLAAAVDGPAPLRHEVQVGEDVDHVVARTLSHDLESDLLGQRARTRKSGSDQLHRSFLLWLVLEPAAVNGPRLTCRGGVRGCRTPSPDRTAPCSWCGARSRTPAV